MSPINVVTSNFACLQASGAQIEQVVVKNLMETSLDTLKDFHSETRTEAKFGGMEYSNSGKGSLEILMREINLISTL